jgi:hypothetical protein
MENGAAMQANARRRNNPRTLVWADTEPSHRSKRHSNRRIAASAFHRSLRIRENTGTRLSALSPPIGGRISGRSVLIATEFQSFERPVGARRVFQHTFSRQGQTGHRAKKDQ